MFKAGPVMTVQHDEHITRVFAKFVTEGFLSAPVLDDRRRFMGFVDMLDLVAFTVGLFEKEKVAEDEAAGVRGRELVWSEANWEVFWNKLGTFREARVEDVMREIDWSKPSRAHAVRTGFSLLHVMEMMARDNVRRVAVIDAQDKVVGIATQSMIISLLSQNLPLFGPAKDTPVREAHGLLCGDVIAMRADHRALESFKLMAEKNVSGVGVVNAKGSLIDVVSVRDLRGMGTDGAKFWRLYETVATYKTLTRLQFPQQTPRNPLYVTEGDTIERVIKLMDDGNIHRVFEVVPRTGAKTEEATGAEAMGAPAGVVLDPVHVISQRDVIQFTLKLFGMPITHQPAPVPATVATAFV